MKLEHGTVVTNDGKTTSQTIKSVDLKSGKVTTTYVSGGKLLPLSA